MRFPGGVIGFATTLAAAGFRGLLDVLPERKPERDFVVALEAPEPYKHRPNILNLDRSLDGQRVGDRRLILAFEDEVWKRQ